MAFCLEYPINQADNKANIPGVLIGRYPGDSYAGGNPWQLLTAVLAELFYKGASATLNEEVQLDMQARREWTGLFKIAEDAGSLELAEAFLKAGDAILNRLYKYVKNDDGHIAEQIAKNSGAQTSAKDLTWSFANVLSALHYRNTHLQTLADRVAMKKNMNDNMRAKYGRIVGKYSRQESGL
jgi:glucoamylase